MIMAKIIPTVNTDSTAEYQKLIEAYSDLVDELHLDVGDGKFGPVKTLSASQMYWPKNLKISVHSMQQNPLVDLEYWLAEQIETLIIHASAQQVNLEAARKIKDTGLKLGVALLSEVEAQEHFKLLALADEIMIFGGALGYSGGKAQIELLTRVEGLKLLNPKARLSWDGGANEENVNKIAQAGIDKIYVGSAASKEENYAYNLNALRSALD